MTQTPSTENLQLNKAIKHLLSCGARVNPQTAALAEQLPDSVSCKHLILDTYKKMEFVAVMNMLCGRGGDERDQHRTIAEGPAPGSNAARLFAAPAINETSSNEGTSGNMENNPAAA